MENVFCCFIHMLLLYKHWNQSQYISLLDDLNKELHTLTASRVVAALRSGKKPSSNSLKKVIWSGIPYTLSKNSTMAILWIGKRPGGTGLVYTVSISPEMV